MAEIIAMPKLGFDMAEGTLIKWVILEGEEVAKGAILAEIETDKATVEVESNYSGILNKHLVPEGEIVPVNTPIAIVSAPGEEINIDELMGGQLAGGTSERPIVPEAVSESSQKSVSEIEQNVDADEVRLPGGLRASPLARRMAEEQNIDLENVNGSGPMGRIMKKDVQGFMESGASIAEAPAPKSPEKQISTHIPPLGPLPSSPVQEDQIIALNRLRLAIGRRMTVAKQQAPHFYVTREYDVDSLITVRKQVNSLLTDGQKISVNDFVIKAVALTLRSFQNLNASFDGEQVIHHGEVNIGVAVAVEGGLLTIVNRDTDRKPLRQIAEEVRTMVARARDGKVRPNDIEGSTFSVSNLGMYGVEHFSAIINPPEAAILAVAAARQTPVVKDGAVIPGRLMKATISVDHRVSDGAEAAQFMQALADYLENPLRLLL